MVYGHNGNRIRSLANETCPLAINNSIEQVLKPLAVCKNSTRRFESVTSQEHKSKPKVPGMPRGVMVKISTSTRTHNSQTNVR